MKELIGSLVSVHTVEDPGQDNPPQDSATAELDGFVGEAHRGLSRVAQSYDPDPTGTVRRNERQWSGVSVEELAVIAERMDLAEPLSPGTLCANVCVAGIPQFSKLPKGSRLLFPSGAALLIEDGNPPCSYIGERIEARHTTSSGKPAAGKLFPKAALSLRGVVGVVDIAGRLVPGDKIVVQVYEAEEI
jgi:hypothetical protein